MQSILMAVILAVPFIPPAQPSKCPGCGQRESRVSVCSHCGYQYAPREIKWWEPPVVIVCGAFFLWWFVTILTWFADNDGGQRSLRDVIRGQVEFISKLRI